MSMKKNENSTKIIEGALAGGLVGTALGAVLSGKRSDTIVAALLGAAIGASLKALQEAVDIQKLVMIEEDGILYYLYPDGSKEFIRRLKKISSSQIPSSFTI